MLIRSVLIVAYTLTERRFADGAGERRGEQLAQHLGNELAFTAITGPLQQQYTLEKLSRKANRCDIAYEKQHNL